MVSNVAVPSQRVVRASALFCDGYGLDRFSEVKLYVGVYASSHLARVSERHGLQTCLASGCS